MGGWLSALAWGHGQAGSSGPAVLAADRLHRLLKGAGITSGRRPRAGAAPNPLPPQPLAGVPSPDVGTLAAITNQASDNFFAEMLTKSLGASFGDGGTTGAGLSVVRAEMAKFGVHPLLADGSGLSRANRTTTRQVVRLMERMHAQEIAASWEGSMAIAGRSGTLRKRMRGTAAAGACRGKTGTIIGVSALSGYCTTQGGATVAFSFIENGVYVLGAKRTEDRMLAAIAKYDGVATATRQAG
jgi:D-alanyl-D-alanine carboxypeptidase/D-alanyl-D-alanine-endopeptidase (penicillin-binding protein 4)